MAETLTIARPYAEALFKLARQQNTLAAWADVLASFSAALANADLQSVIGSPHVSEETLVDVFVKLAGNSPVASSEVKNFVALLAENKRLQLLASIEQLFNELKLQSEGVVTAQIQTAFPLNTDEVHQLCARLEQRVKQKVQAEISVVPELIGGVKILLGDEVIDASVRGSLDNMAVALKA